MNRSSAMGEMVVESRTLPGAWTGGPGDRPLDEVITAWSASPDAQQDPFRTRQLLAQVAIHLVQAFRAQEARLFRAQAPERHKRRAENHRLALQLWDLMAAAELGFDVAPGIHAILGVSPWQEARQTTRITGPAFDH